MPFDIHTSHRAILIVPLAIYVVLVYFVAVAPALEMNRRYPPSDPALVEEGGETAPQGAGTTMALSDRAKRGEVVFKAYGCVVCHTQQIRGDERLRVQIGDRMLVPVRAPDARYGLDEPTRPEDYANASPPLLGTQRTGPDLTGDSERRLARLHLLVLG